MLLQNRFGIRPLHKFIIGVIEKNKSRQPSLALKADSFHMSGNCCKIILQMICWENWSELARSEPPPQNAILQYTIEGLKRFKHLE